MVEQDVSTEGNTEAQSEELMYRKLHKGRIRMPSDFVSRCPDKRVIVYMDKFLIYNEGWRKKLTQETSIKIFPYQIFINYEEEFNRLLKDYPLEMKEWGRFLGSCTREAQITMSDKRVTIRDYELEYIEARRDSVVLVTLKADRLQIRNLNLERKLEET